MKTFDELAEQFIEEIRSGQSPTPEGYANRYPEFADDIKELFSTLVILEKGSHQDTLANLSSFGLRAGNTAVPTQIAEYQIVREIGRGGMGIVYEARDETLDRPVALKILQVLHGDQDQAIRRFQREARMAARLHHSNIVPVFESGIYNDQFYYVMQYIAGIGIDQLLQEINRLRRRSASSKEITSVSNSGSSAGKTLPSENSSLAETVASSIVTETSPGDRMPKTYFGKRRSSPVAKNSDTISPTTAFDQLHGNSYLRSFPSLITLTCQIGIQVGQALECAHSHLILHRDIKPSNLLLDEKGVVWITDFGLAKPTNESDITQDGQIIGTLRYMAPEGLQGNFSPQSDIYSLGLTLYELLTLSPAFDETNYSRLIAQINESSFTAPRKLDPSIPKDLETIILKATEADPKSRYQRASELVDDLKRFSEERPILARRVSAAEHLWRWTCRNRLLASLLVTIASLAFFLFCAISAGFVHSRILLAEKEQESRRAQNNLQVALSAFEKMFSAFQGDDQPFSIPYEDRLLAGSSAETAVSEQEAKMLESLLDFYEQFSQENSDDRKLLLETARAYARVGIIRQKLGRTKNSIEATRKAFQFYQQGIDLSQDKERIKHSQLERASFMVEFLLGINRPSQIRPDDINAISLMIDEIEPLTNDRTIGQNARILLFMLLYQRASLTVQIYLREKLRNVGDLSPNQVETVFRSIAQEEPITQSLCDLQHSRELLSKALANDPENIALLISKIRSNLFLVILRLLESNTEETFALEQEAIDISKRLLALDPADRLYRTTQIDLNLSLAYAIRLDTGRPGTDSIPLLEETVRLTKELESDYPKLLQYQADIIYLEYSIGRVWVDTAENEKAIPYFERAYNLLKKFRDEYPFYTDLQKFPPLYYWYATALITINKPTLAKTIIQEMLAVYTALPNKEEDDLHRQKQFEQLEQRCNDEPAVLPNSQ